MLSSPRSASEHDHFDKFNKRWINISVAEASEETKKLEKIFEYIKNIKSIHMLKRSMFVIYFDHPNITLSRADVFRTINTIKTASIFLFEVQMNIFRPTV